MIVMKPELRHSTRRCYEEASRLPVPSQDCCLTLTLASDAEGYEPTVVYYHVEEQEVREQSSNEVSTAKHLYSPHFPILIRQLPRSRGRGQRGPSTSGRRRTKRCGNA